MNVSGIQTGLVTATARDPQTPDAARDDEVRALLADLAPMLDRAFSANATPPAPATATAAATTTTTSPAAATSNANAQQGGTDLENAMSATQAKDPTLFAKTMKDAQSGDGNALVEDELQAYKEGAITKQQAIEEVSGAQKLANDHGGGKINGHVKSDAQALLGGSYIKGGQTRAGHAISKFFESFNPIGAIVKGVKDKTSKPSEDVLSAAQPALSRGVQRAMADMQSSDPTLAQKFQQDASKGDGNAMVDDMVSLKNEQQSGAVPNTFSDQDAQLLGSQVGALGKGKVNSAEDQKFAQAFGTDTLYRGSSAASKTWNKIEDKAGSFMQQIVSPVTDTVGGAIDLVHGDVKGAFSEFGKAFVGAATDAAMVVAPEAAPEVEAGVMAARGGAEAAKLATTSDGAVSSLMKGAKMVDKGNDYANHANDAVNYLTGDNSNNGNNGNSQQVG